jgi:hypothetical protein
MSPVTSTPGLKPAADASPKGPVELSVQGAPVPQSAPKPVPATVLSTAASMVQPTIAEMNSGTLCDALPALNAGKPIPSLEEWRALERRASSFRV